jgi:hypothetical protein
MKRLLIAATCVCAFAIILAPQASAQTNYFVCTFTLASPQGSTAYVTGMIEARAELADVDSSWERYARATYHPADARSHGNCLALSSDPKIRQKQATDLTAKKWDTAAQKLLPENWGYTPPPARPSNTAVEHTSNQPAAVPARQATASDGILHYFCVSNPGQPITYFTAAFDSTESNGRVIDGRFGMYLGAQYHKAPQSGPSCPTFPSAAAARAEEERRIHALRSTNQNVVITSWTYAGR